MIIKSALFNNLQDTSDINDSDITGAVFTNIEVDEEIYEKRKDKIELMLNILQHAPLETLVELLDSGYSNFREILLELLRDFLFMVDDDQFRFIYNSIILNKEE